MRDTGVPAQQIAHRARRPSKREPFGRQFENATAEDFQALFVQAFRDWRADLWGEGRRSQVADASAEYTLRGADPPYALVDDDLLEIGSAVAEDVALLDEYLAAPKSRH